MIENELIKIEQEKSIIKDIRCDKCGQSCSKDVGGFPLFNYMSLNSTWGYGSDKDGEDWAAEICQSCAEELSHSIKFRVIQRDVFGNTYFE